jgi:hypothetical protein
MTLSRRRQAARPTPTSALLEFHPRYHSMAERRADSRLPKLHTDWRSSVPIWSTPVAVSVYCGPVWAPFANPLVVILVVASIVSGFVGETFSAVIIVTIVLLSVALDFFQSFRSEKAASRLQSLVTLTASVFRDGEQSEVAVRDVVPGDLLQLRAGDLVPADATLAWAITLSVTDESKVASAGTRLPARS